MTQATIDAAKDYVRTSMQNKRRKWPLVTLVVLLCAGAAGFVGVRARGPRGEKIDPSLVATVTRGELEIAVTELGKIEPREKVAIKSKVAGQAQEVLVDEGQRVKKGQLLLVLDPIDFQRNVVRAEQEVQKAQAQLELAVLTLDRRKKGLAERGVAQVDVDLAENDVKQKRIALAQSREALAQAGDQLRFSRLTAPMEGTITQRTIQPGETVVPGVASTFDDRSLMIVSDLSVLIAKAELNQIDVAKVRLGQVVTLTLDALPGKSYQAKVTKIAPASTLPKGKDVDVFPIEATLAPEGTADIKPGMTADIKVHVETKRGVLKLPIEAVVKEKGQSYALRIVRDRDGKERTERVTLEVGARNDRDQELLRGLAEGDRVQIKPPSAEQNEFK